jgi:diadenosine tetraphosphate (Ap4A) HIT family hydrolase
VRTLGKEEALAELQAHRLRLLPDGAGCVMCALAQGRGEPLPLVETESAVVVLDRFAQRLGHLLVITRRHVEAVSAIDWPLFAHIQRLVYQSRLALDRAFVPLQIYAGMFGATVPLPMTFAHCHAHVIPVYESDERARPARVLSWSEGVVVYDDEEAQALRARILDCWPSCDEYGWDPDASRSMP